MLENIDVILVEETILADINDITLNISISEPVISVNISESQPLLINITEETILATIGTEIINVNVESIGSPNSQPKWYDLVTGYSIEPVRISSPFDGELYRYNYFESVVLYRAIYNNGDDIFYRNYSNSILSDEIARKSISIG